MPIYEYECIQCGIFEEIQQVGEKLQSCPVCSGKIKKLLSVVTGTTVYKNSKEHYEKVIKPEAKDIANKIKQGNEDAAADILGEQAVSEGNIKEIMDKSK